MPTMRPFTDDQVRQITCGLEREEDFVFLETSRVTSADDRSLLFLNPGTWLVCRQEDDADRFLRETQAWLDRGYFVAGWLAYEFATLLEPLAAAVPDRGAGQAADRPLALLGVFAEPLVHRHAGGDVAAFLAAAGLATGDAGSRSGCAVHNLRTNIGRDDYLQAIRRIQDYIRAGDTYQVNFTLRLDFDFTGSPAALYRRLRRNQSVAYGAWIRHRGRDVMSFSPELFFEAVPGRVRVRPMKGTMARGRTTGEDRQRAEMLRNDVKNRSENVMIVDLLRNDLGRLLHETGGGRVRPRSLFDVEVYETVLQMTSTIDALAGDDRRRFGLRQLLHALFPCGSVTGAPKIRTMEIIRELERDPRGVYCGAIGFAGRDESLFNVPIRTLELSGGRGSMGIGSGVVHDSDPGAEWQECLLKGRFLTRPAPVFHLIETLLWLPDDGYFLLGEHLRRLADSAAYFLFSHDDDMVRHRLSSLADSFAGTPMRVRLLLARDGELQVSAHPLAGKVRRPSPEPGGDAPLPRVCFSSLRTDPDDVFLYHKTTRRSLYDRERQQVVDRGGFEVLFTNTRGEVTEGSISNVFLRKEGRMFTPPVECGLLAGTFRGWLLRQGAVRERVLAKSDLLSADAVYIGNSLRGLLQVEIDTKDERG